MNKHPLKKWLNFNGMTSMDLEKISGINASTIRHIYGGNPASVKKYRKISKATGIRPEVLMFPEQYPDFDISNCKPDNICESVDC